jgi:dihydroxyacid dehydratase/phosphogluconate dehydratase
VYATGLDDEDLKKAQVGISSVWYEGNPCNMHLLDLAQKVKEGVAKAGLIGYRFNTIGVSDGISMGTDGMRYSLQSRDLIADSIETVSVYKATAVVTYHISLLANNLHRLWVDNGTTPTSVCLAVIRICLVY